MNFKAGGTTVIGQSYRVLRQGGAPPSRAAIELDVDARQIRTLERRLARPTSGSGHPRFARHADHVTAALRAGGYPVLRGARGS
jgi:hypothetical protein